MGSAKDPSFLHVDSNDSDQTRWIPRLICVFAGRTVTLLVLSCCGSYFLQLLIGIVNILSEPVEMYDDLTQKSKDFYLGTAYLNLQYYPKNK